MNDERVFLGLGANFGDRMANLVRAVEELKTAGVRVVQSSSVYETEPVGGPPDQDSYLNAAIEVATSLTPREMLDLCKKIETDLGRVPGPRWGPRRIDVDILLWGDRVVDEPDLEIPHVEMANRAFVLGPLDEIAPEVYNPQIGRTVHELAIQLRDMKGVERLSGPFVEDIENRLDP
jgi:2-amino-4-hydroxy-6-hydroxymethyldihydropteridine diphosphokinase